MPSLFAQIRSLPVVLGSSSPFFSLLLPLSHCFFLYLPLHLRHKPPNKLPHHIPLTFVLLVVPPIHRNTGRDAPIFPRPTLLLNMMEPSGREIQDLVLVHGDALRSCVFVQRVRGDKVGMWEEGVDRDPRDGVMSHGAVEGGGEGVCMGAVDVAARPDVACTQRDFIDGGVQRECLGSLEDKIQILVWIAVGGGHAGGRADPDVDCLGGAEDGGSEGEGCGEIAQERGQGSGGVEVPVLGLQVVDWRFGFLGCFQFVEEVRERHVQCSGLKEDWPVLQIDTLQGISAAVGRECDLDGFLDRIDEGCAGPGLSGTELPAWWEGVDAWEASADLFAELDGRWVW